MRKKATSKGKHLKSVILYLDDINEILDKLDICSEIEFSDGEYEYNSLDEIKGKKGNKLRTLSINGHDPYISIGINKYNIWLYTDGSSTDAITRFAYLKDFLNGKSPWYSKIFNVWFWYIAGLAYFLTVPILLLKYFKIDPLTNHFFLIITGIIILCAFLTAYVHFKGSSIHLESKHHVKNFFSRNGDNITILVIGIIIGWLLNLISKLVFKF